MWSKPTFIVAFILVFLWVFETLFPELFFNESSPSVFLQTSPSGSKSIGDFGTSLNEQNGEQNGTSTDSLTHFMTLTQSHMQNFQNTKSFFTWKRMNNDETQLFFTSGEIASMTTSKQVASCDRSIISGRCCIGAMSSGGEQVWRPGKSCVNDNISDFSRSLFSRYFRPTLPDGKTREFLFNPVDILAMLENTKNTTISFIGDSVSHQMFDSFICAIMRIEGATTVSGTGFSRKKKRWKVGTAVRYETSVMFNETNYNFVFHREFTFSKDGRTIQEICSTDSDILVINYGLHWNTHELYFEDMKFLMAFIKQHCLSRGIQVIFRGTTSQHFKTFGGSYATSNKKNSKDEYEKFILNSTGFNISQSTCTKMRFRDSRQMKSLFSWRDRLLVESAQSSNLTVYETPWGKSATGCMDTKLSSSLFFIPFGALTASLDTMHKSECTHYCYTPELWAPVWDAIYLAVRQRSKDLCHIDLPSKPQHPRKLQNPRLPKIKIRNTPRFQIPGLANSTIYS